MPLHASSYIAGVATVVATMALGFGGGILMTDALVGSSENPPTLVERRASPLSESTTPPVATAPNSETTPNPTPPMAPVVAAAPNPAAPAANPIAAVHQPQPAVSSAPSPAAPSAQPITAPQAAPVPASAVALAVAPMQPPPEDAMAKARDEEVKKALAAERRKAERRKWAERRKQEMMKIEELNAVAEKVKDAERERGPVVRSFVAQSPGILIGGD